jgi:hypothetical protein
MIMNALFQPLAFSIPVRQLLAVSLLLVASLPSCIRAVGRSGCSCVEQRSDPSPPFKDAESAKAPRIGNILDKIPVSPGERQWLETIVQTARNNTIISIDIASGIDVRVRTLHNNRLHCARLAKGSIDIDLFDLPADNLHAVFEVLLSQISLEESVSRPNCWDGERRYLIGICNHQISMTFEECYGDRRMIRELLQNQGDCSLDDGNRILLEALIGDKDSLSLASAIIEAIDYFDSTCSALAR